MNGFMAWEIMGHVLGAVIPALFLKRTSKSTDMSVRFQGRCYSNQSLMTETKSVLKRTIYSTNETWAQSENSPKREKEVIHISVQHAFSGSIFRHSAKRRREGPRKTDVSILFSQSCNRAVTYDVQVNPTLLGNRSFVKDGPEKKDLASYNSQQVPHQILNSAPPTIALGVTF